MVKPVNASETVMWCSALVALPCAVVTGVVRDNWSGAWVSFLVAMVILIAASGERRRVLRERDGSGYQSGRSRPGSDSA